MKKIIFFAAALLSLGGPLCAQSGGGLTPYKLNVFQDAAQVTAKGIMRFEKKSARFPLAWKPVPGTVEFLPSGDYQVNWYRMRTDTLVRKVPAATWPEILNANAGKNIVLIYQVGNEYDELAGEVSVLSEADSMLLLRRSSGEEFFIPMNQVRQVMIDTLATTQTERKIAQELVEVGISQDLNFSPIEMGCLVEGISWIPTCRIRIVNQKTAVVEIGGVLRNDAVDFTDAELEFTPGNILSGDLVSAESYTAGKFSLHKGEQMQVNLRRVDAELTEQAEGSAPWRGNEAGGEARRIPVKAAMRFKPAQPLPGSLGQVSIFDPKNRLVARSEPVYDGGALMFPQGTLEDVIVTYKDAELKRVGKPVKVNDQIFIKANMESRVQLQNNRKTPVTLVISREVEGDVTDPAKGAVSRNAENTRSTITWTVGLGPGEKKDIILLYDLNVPYQAE